MRAALDRSKEVRTYRDYVDRFGLGYEVTRKGQVTFPAYVGSLSMSNARALP